MRLFEAIEARCYFPDVVKARCGNLSEQHLPHMSMQLTIGMSGAQYRVASRESHIQLEDPQSVHLCGQSQQSLIHVC